MKVNRDGLTSKILDEVEVNDLQSLRVVNWNTTQFGEDLVAERFPLLELNSSYGVSALRDITEEVGSGTVAANRNKGLIEVRTGTTTGSRALIESAEVGRYHPGQGAEFGVAVRVPVQPTGDGFMRWGGRSQNDDDFVGFGYDATGVYIQVVRDGVEKLKLYQADWNLDPLDGTGQSDVNLDLQTGNIYQVDFTWYGFGEILFSVVERIVDASGNRRQLPIRVHSYRPSNETSVKSPNMKVFAEVENGTGTQDVELDLGGRQFSNVGIYNPKTRLTSQWANGSISTGTTPIPLVSFRRKTDFNDRSIKLKTLAGIAGNAPHILQAYVGGTLTGPSWVTPTDHTAAETALEADVTASAITGGVCIKQVLVAGGAASARSVTREDLDFDLPGDQVITLAARTLSGTSTIAAALLELSEEW